MSLEPVPSSSSWKSGSGLGLSKWSPSNQLIQKKDHGLPHPLTLFLIILLAIKFCIMCVHCLHILTATVPGRNNTGGKDLSGSTISVPHGWEGGSEHPSSQHWRLHIMENHDNNRNQAEYNLQMSIPNDDCISSAPPPKASTAFQISTTTVGTSIQTISLWRTYQIQTIVSWC